MPIPTPAELERCPCRSLMGSVQRVHRRHIPADNFEGHLYAAGRMHMRGDGRIAYTSLDGRTAVLEMVRHLYDDVQHITDLDRLLREQRERLRAVRITEFILSLERVIDLVDLTIVGRSEAEFLADHRWEQGPHPSQEIGRGVRAAGYEAALVPSATRRRESDPLPR